jgi:hypothetical protein
LRGRYAVARKTTVKAFGEWIAAPGNEDHVLDLIVSGRTLQRAAVELKQPYTCLQAHFHSTPELLQRYNLALRSYADFLQGEAKEIADEVVADKDEVAKAKLRVEVRQNQAKALGRDRWGDKLQVEKSVSFEVDQALLGTVSDLLRIAREKVVSVQPAAPALPALMSDKE